MSSILNAQEQKKSNWIRELSHAPSLRIYAKNVGPKLQVAEIENYAIPYFVVDRLSKDAYICSNITGFIYYSRDELKLVPSLLARWGTHLVLLSCSVLLKLAQINRAVFVNNFLFSTNLYPKEGFTDETIREWTDRFTRQYPDHVIFWRSLTDYSHQKLLDQFKAHGYGLIPSRQIYVLDQNLGDFSKKRDVINDQKLLKKTELIPVENHEILETDFDRITELYRLLYIEKHSIYNPEYTAAFMRSGHRAGVIDFFGLRNRDGVLEGIIGHWERDGIIATPIFGYNTSLPQELGLYRMLNARQISESIRRKIPLHYSSGAASFKRLRGARDFIEYSAVHYRHLKSPFRRFVWKLLERSANAIAIKLLKEYKL